VIGDFLTMQTLALPLNLARIHKQLVVSLDFDLILEPVTPQIQTILTSLDYLRQMQFLAHTQALLNWMSVKHPIYAGNLPGWLLNLECSFGSIWSVRSNAISGGEDADILVSASMIQESYITVCVPVFVRCCNLLCACAESVPGCIRRMRRRSRLRTTRSRTRS